MYGRQLQEEEEGEEEEEEKEKRNSQRSRRKTISKIMISSSPSPPAVGQQPVVPVPTSTTTKTVPIRKQSVFVAPTGLSSIRPPISHEAIKQRIDKMIMENAAIVESVAHNSHHHHQHNSGHHHHHHHHRYRTSSGGVRQSRTSTPIFSSIPQQQQSSPNNNIDLAIRNYHHHHIQSNHHHHHPQVIHDVIIENNNDNNNSTSGTYSKLQSALLGATTSTPKSDHIGGGTMIPPTIPPPLPPPPLPGTYYHHHHGHPVMIQPVVGQPELIVRKYSDQHHHLPPPPPPPPTFRNSSGNNDSLFPSLFNTSSSSSSSSLQQLSHSSPKPSVIINTRDLQTMIMSNNNDPHHHLIETSHHYHHSSDSRNNNNSSSSMSSEKSCLVRNLLLNSNVAAKRLSTGSPPVFNNSNSNNLNSSSNNNNSTLRNGSEQNSGSSDTSIIKDLLLKSRTDFDSVTGGTGGTQPPPETTTMISRKRSRQETIINPVSMATKILEPPVASTSSLINQNVYTCPLCSIQYRNEQNLEVHQKYYCRQQQNGLKQRKTSRSTSSTTIPNSSSISANRERKISSLDRPSIINYPTRPTPVIPVTLEENSNSAGGLSSSSSSSDSGRTPEIEQRKRSIIDQQSSSSYNFGNILKSKLLAATTTSVTTTTTTTATNDDDGDEIRGYCPRKHKETDNPKGDDSHGYPPPFSHRINADYNSHFQSLKKRKTSEPAFRLQYHHYGESKTRESTVRQHRNSVLQSIKNDEDEDGSEINSNKSSIPLPSSTIRASSSSSSMSVPKLEIIPAYMPYLMRPATKISIKAPVIFPVLQSLIDNFTNHEFTLIKDSVPSSPGPGVEESSIKDNNESPKFLVKQEEELIEQQELLKLIDDLINDVVESSSTDTEQQVNKCVTDLIDTVVAGNGKPLPSPPERPKTLDFSRERIWNLTDPTVSILVNRCSYNKKDQNSIMVPNQLFPSTLVSPDTPRWKRKQEKLFLNGNTYSNLGLKVSLRPTYCCMYRLQPMFVMQEANPQLSMYSQWKTHPIPDGDPLALVKTPNQLLSAYDSNEAIYYAAVKSRLRSMETSNTSTIVESSLKGGITEISTNVIKETTTTNSSNDPTANHHPGTTTTVTKLECPTSSFSCCRYLNNHLPTTGSSKSLSRKLRRFERTFKSSICLFGDGFIDRIVDITTETFLILVHSSLSSITGKSIAQPPPPSSSSSSSSNKRKNRVSFSSVPLFERTENSNVSIENMLIKNENELSMIPLEKSKQAMVYFMMMAQQVSPKNALPSVQQIMSSARKHLATVRKFSDCTGLKPGPNAYDQEQAWRIAGQDGFTPKRIKIFEGGFKSNEDYTYIRGRGRGKYMCENCGIRCKKPSMLKKHIRTHTNLRPYSCQHCRFAFKTKGNLTKHMKSKAHHKKCVELGVIPVPTSIDDSQIDNNALAQQELFEMNSQNSLNSSTSQFGDDDDDEFDEEDPDDDDDDDDDGIPIESSVYSGEPGQFDDATEDTVDDADKRKTRMVMETSVSSSMPLSSSSMRKISSKGLAIGIGSSPPPPPPNGGPGGDNVCQRNRTMSDNVVVDEQRRSPDRHLPSSAVLNIEPNNDDNHRHHGLKERLNIVQPLATVSPNHHHGISSSSSPSSSSSTIVASQNENEAEAVHSLLILSSGGSSMPLSTGGGVLNRNTSSNHYDLISNAYQQQSTTTATPVDGQRNSSRSSSTKGSSPVMKSKNSITESSTGKSPTMLPVAAGTTLIPEYYGFDSVTLKPQPPPPPLFVDNNKINVDYRSMPQQQQASYPTSVIIANHQATLETTSNHQDSSEQFHARKRSRTSPLESITTNPNRTINANTKSNNNNKSNPHSISALITTPPQQPIHHQHHRSAGVSSAFSIVDSGQRRTVADLTTAVIQQSIGRPMVDLAPPLIPAQYFTSSPPAPPPPPPSNPTTRIPGSLPTIVEPSSSLNRYPTTATNHQTIQKSPPVVVQDQDQPIDLSAKSNTTAAVATTLPVIIENGSLELPTDVVQQNSVIPAPPSGMIGSHHHHRLSDSAQPMIERHRLTEQMVRSFSTYDDVMAQNFSSPNQTVNGHAVYQNLRSQEFAHLAPGIHSPHRLPINLRSMINQQQQPSSSSPSPQQHQTSVVQQSSSTGKSASPTGSVMNENKNNNGKTFSEEKPTCPTCMKQFAKPSLLRLHYNLHQFERPFRCESCAISFRTKGHLQKHARSVSHMNKLNMSITFGRPSTDNPRPFKCSDCKIAFRIHGHLAKHLRSKMHIMKLECLGKLPFGMFAEIERKNINLTSIDTSNCAKALETLQILAQSLYNTTQMCWKNASVVLGSSNGSGNGDQDDDTLMDMMEDDADGEETMDEEDCASESTIGTTPGKSSTTTNQSPNLIPNGTGTNPAVPNTSNKNSGTTIASTRSNTCDLCGQVFKAAKFLQVHIYCEHPETTATGNDSSPTAATGTATAVATSA